MKISVLANYSPITGTFGSGKSFLVRKVVNEKIRDIIDSDNQISAFSACINQDVKSTSNKLMLIWKPIIKQLLDSECQKLNINKKEMIEQIFKNSKYFDQIELFNSVIGEILFKTDEKEEMDSKIKHKTR